MTFTAFVATVAAIVCWGWCAPKAAAITVFGSKGQHAGQLTEPHGVAVDQKTGDVYVADTNNQRIDRFGPNGEFKYAFGWGVVDGASELEVCTVASGCRAGVAGGGAGEFNFPQGIAVDNNPASPSYGAVYVLDSRNQRVQKFGTSGEFLLAFGGKVNEETGGSVCVAGETCTAGSAGVEEGEFFLPGGAIAVGSNDDVYVGDFNRVQSFSPGGEHLSGIPIAEAGFVSTVGVSTSGTILVAAELLTGVHSYDAFGKELGTPIDTEQRPTTLTLGPADEVFIVNAQFDESQPGIVEYDASGNQVASFGTGTHGDSRGIAYSEALASVYVPGSASVDLIPLPPSGPLVVEGSESTEERGPTTAKLTALVDPEGNSTSYFFEYGPDSSYGSRTPATELSTLSAFENAHAAGEAVGLSPNTTYHFRVVAEDAHGKITFGEDATFTTLPPVLIDGESATNVTSESARLRATIDPLGTATDYHFDYGTTTAYGSSAPVPDGSLGARSENIPVSLLVESLTPGVTYHFRVVAHNSLGEVVGEDHSFTTLPGGGFSLADARTWELVSPPGKGGVALESLPEEGGLIQAAEDGSALTYVALGPINSETAGNRSGMFTQLLSRRTPSGWSTENITTPREHPVGVFAGFRGEYPLFASDLTKGLVEPASTERLSPEATEQTPYLREGDAYRPVLTPGNVTSGEKFGGVEHKPGEFEGAAGVVSATPSFKDLVVHSPVALTSGFTVAGESTESLYLWHEGALQLASVLPDGKAAAETGTQSFLGYKGLMARRAISEEGTRVIFEANKEAEVHLFVRDMSAGVTVQLDLNENGESGQGAAHFQDASADGRKIFFTDTEQLTSNASGELTKADLYECELEGTGPSMHCNLTNLTVPQNPGEASDVLGTIPGTGESGDRVYFVANGALAAGAVSGDCPEELSGEIPTSARCNLYVYDAGAKELKLIAVLSGADFPDWSGINPRNLGELTTRVSPSGQYLAFMSQRSLTGYDNRDSESSAPDEEVYLYDAGHDTLACVSCNPSGGRPKGMLDSGKFPRPLVDRSGTWAGRWIAASIPGWTRASVTRALYQSHYLSNSGRVFFNAEDALAPQDVNGTEDVYEYEPDHVGSCSREDGCVALMSSGAAQRETAFLDASGDGSDVFFLSPAKLAAGDTDNELDVYDAHVCAGSCPPETSGQGTTSCSTVESCRGYGPEAIAAQAPPVTVGEGNVKPPVPAPAHVSPSKAQRLAEALHSCRRKHGRARRTCEARARKRYGVRGHSKTRRAK